MLHCSTVAFQIIMHGSSMLVPFLLHPHHYLLWHMQCWLRRTSTPFSPPTAHFPLLPASLNVSEEHAFLPTLPLYSDSGSPRFSHLLLHHPSLVFVPVIFCDNMLSPSQHFNILLLFPPPYIFWFCCPVCLQTCVHSTPAIPLHIFPKQ